MMFFRLTSPRIMPCDFMIATHGARFLSLSLESNCGMVTAATAGGGTDGAANGGGGTDGGVDLVLRRGNDKFLVQCKQWKAFKVPVQPMRELYGVMTA